MNAAVALARSEIVTLKPYAHAAWLPSLTRLHANEAPWRPSGDATAGGLNRYPEPQPHALIERLAALYRVPTTNLLATHGSDEAIDLLSRIYLRPHIDAILQCTPTFGMYQVAARIQGAGVLEVALDRERGWMLDPERVIAAWQPNIKLVYLCSPNNPTSNLIAAGALEEVCVALDGKAIVVIDEAYIEWFRRWRFCAPYRKRTRWRAPESARCSQRPRSSNWRGGSRRPTRYRCRRSKRRCAPWNRPSLPPHRLASRGCSPSANTWRRASPLRRWWSGFGRATPTFC
jgi:hypothetical protein